MIKMGVFEFLIAAVVVTGIVRIVQAKHGIRRDKWGNEVATADSQENLRLKEEITDLKGRIATLERIATDNNSALDLDREIERLR
jgi:hypothetical protein